MNPFVRALACPSGFMTTTLAGPVFPCGVTATSCVLVGTVTEMVEKLPGLILGLRGRKVPGGVRLTKATELAGTPPKVTVAPSSKLLPLIVTVVPPVIGPVLGLTADTPGAEADGRRVSVVKAFPPQLPQAVKRIVTAMIKVPSIFPPKEARYRNVPGNIVQSSHLSPPQKSVNSRRNMKQCPPAAGSFTGP